MYERLQQAKEQISAIPRDDLWTVPNFITMGRLAFSPVVAKRLYDDPGGTWHQAGAFVFSDIFDGFFARLGEKSELLAKLGFRTSEFGRVADPVTDVIVTSEMIAAGMLNGTVPKWLGGAALAQKAVKSENAASAVSEGAEIHVSILGKRSELLTNTGFGLLFIGESIEDQETKETVRKIGIAAAAVGISGAFIADRQYKSEAERQLAVA